MPDTTLSYIILEDSYYVAIDLRDTVKRLRPSYLLTGIAEETTEAISMVRRYEPDLMIADTLASDGDSISILQQAGIDIPVIFISEYSRLAERAKALNLAGFILKPVTSSDLQHVLDNLEAKRVISKQTINTTL